MDDARACSRDASVIVGIASIQAVRFDGSVVQQVVPGGLVSSQAEDCSADGSVVVGGYNDGTEHPFRWSPADGFTPLGELDPANPAGVALGVSGDGSVIVGESKSGGTCEAFRWTSTGGMVGLGTLLPNSPTSNSTAVGVNPDGTIIVGRSSSGLSNEAFVWTPTGGMQGLGFLPGTPRGASTGTAAFDCSADGSVIVGSGINSLGEQVAVIWIDQGQPRELKDVLVTDYGLAQATSIPMTSALAVSDDGRTICGGNWIVVLPQQPGCPSDVNTDTTIDVNDVSFVLFRLGQTGPLGELAGDVDCNGVVDVNDIAFVIFRLGTACP